MEEIKELGVKVAANKDEAFWTKARDATEARIFEMERTLEIEKEILKFLNSKLK